MCSVQVVNLLHPPLRLFSALLFILNYINHIPGRFLSTLCVSARSIATVTTFCGFSSFTIVVTDIDGGGICSLLPDCARSSMVEKLGGRRHADTGQPDLKSARSFHAYLRTLASSSSSGGGRLGREWKRSTEHSCFPASATSPSTSLFVSFGWRSRAGCLVDPFKDGTDWLVVKFTGGLLELETEVCGD